ncbi:MAG: ATP-binding protein, partial [Spirochaetales bacterium]|nr:ATP-binding protein [Spirochaetales bacterium]
AVDLDKEGNISRNHDRRTLFFPFAPELLTPGTNHLVIRLWGDPAYMPLGLHSAQPYYITQYSEMQKKNNEVVAVTFIGLYLFIGIYHIFIFLTRRQDRYNLFYGLFSADLAVYLFSRTHTVYSFIANTRVIFVIELSSLFLLMPFIAAFLDWLRYSKLTVTTKVFSLFCFSLIAGILFLPRHIGFDLLGIWQVFGLAMAVYYILYGIVIRFFIDQVKRWRRQPRDERRNLFLVIFDGLRISALGNLVFGALFLFATAFYDIFDALVLHQDLVLTKYGFFVFTMSTAFILANRFNFLHVRLHELNQTLEERIQDLTATSQLLRINEKKYRCLFEGTSDPVALLDEELSFIEGNAAAMSLFGLDRPGTENLNLRDILYGQEVERNQGILSIDRAMRSLSQSQKPKELKFRIRTPLGEPKTCRIRLEAITAMNQSEILLHVRPEDEDPLMECFVEGREVYSIESTLSAADEATRRITHSLKRYLDAEEANYLMICLREIIINAVEHGNLEISFDDKSRAQQEQKYFEFIQERQQMDEFKDRTVTIEYSITQKRAIYRVTDMGPGFDHRSFLKNAHRHQEEILEHGRGLFMTLSAFDTVKYNEKGNQVSLIKNFN